MIISARKRRALTALSTGESAMKFAAVFEFAKFDYVNNINHFIIIIIIIIISYYYLLLLLILIIIIIIIILLLNISIFNNTVHEQFLEVAGRLRIDVQCAPTYTNHFYQFFQYIYIYLLLRGHIVSMQHALFPDVS